MIPRRTRWQPGEEQSLLEKRYRNLLQAQFQSILPHTHPRMIKLKADIDSLKAQLEAPKPTRAAPKPSGNKSETRILREVINALRRHPKVARVWRQNSGTFRKQHGNKTHYIRANTAHGMSDIQAILTNGKSCFVEVKSATGRLMPHQAEFLAEMRKAGAVAFVARDAQDIYEPLESA